MRVTKKQGFTIVEVMMFLAITGLIMAVLLVGWGALLNQQRYSDAGSSLLTYIRGQYNLVANVNNSREGLPGSSACNDAGHERGATDCTIVGRIVQVSDSGSTINSAKIIATADVAQIDQTNKTDITILQEMNLVSERSRDDPSRFNFVEYRPMWNTTPYAMNTSSPPGRHSGGFTIVIVRMPTSGIIRTLVSYSGSATVRNVVDGAQAREFLVCLNPDGLVGESRPKLGVRIGANAANAGAVEAAKMGDCI